MNCVMQVLLLVEIVFTFHNVRIQLSECSILDSCQKRPSTVMLIETTNQMVPNNS